VRKILLVLVVLFQCAGLEYNSWSEYSIRYIGSEDDLAKFTTELCKKGYAYKVITYDDGVYEVQYKLSEKK
jgi:hypothetical protein